MGGSDRGRKRAGWKSKPELECEGGQVISGARERRVMVWLVAPSTAE